MVTWLAETCRWLLYCIIKLTFIHSSAFFGAYKNFEYHIRARNKEHKLLNLAVFFRRFYSGFKWKIQAGAKTTWHQRRLYWQYLTFIDYLKRSKCSQSTLIHCRSLSGTLGRTKVPVVLSKSHPITGLDRPLGLQEVEVSRISRQSEHENGKVVSPTPRKKFTRLYPWHSFLLDAELTAKVLPIFSMKLSCVWPIDCHKHRVLNEF